MGCPIRVGVAVAVLHIVAAVEAQEAHVYGPSGTSEDRRVMAVVEDAEGRCIPAEDVEWTSDDADLSALNVAGPCVRWLRLRSSEGADHILIHGRGGGTHASTAVPMNDAETLEVRATRRGRRLRVTVPGVTRGESVSGYVQSTAGRIALEEVRPGVLRANVPRAGVLGIVVHQGALVGVTALPGEAGAPRVLVLEAERAVEAAGPPREAAYIIAVDENGRLSRGLPLNIESTRGVLRSMRWLHPGIAVVGLSAPLGVDSIDLSVGIGENVLASAELDVIATWPTSVSLLSPPRAAHGESFRIEANGHAVDGTELDVSRVRVRCGAGPWTRPPAICPGQDGPSDYAVVAGVLVDGAVVALAHTEVFVAGPVVPDEHLEVPPSTLQVQVALRGLYDRWSRGGAGAAVRLWFPVASWLRVGIAGDYTARFVRASGVNPALGSLDGVRHEASLLAAIEARLGTRFAGALRLEVGGGWSTAAASLDGAPADGKAAHFVARLAAGPRLVLSRVALGIDLGVETGFDATSRAWGRAPVTGYLEVSGGLAF